MIQKVDPTMAAYVAGFLDGEGTIQLTVRGSGHPHILKAVKIANTNQKVLADIQAVFGGQVRRVRESTDKAKAGYTLEFTNTANIRELLTSLLPYLRLKRTQAELMLTFTERRAGSRNTEFERVLCAAMSVLNRRGV